MKLSGPALLLADTDPVEELEPDEVYLIPVGGAQTCSCCYMPLAAAQKQ